MKKKLLLKRLKIFRKTIIVFSLGKEGDKLWKFFKLIDKYPNVELKK